MSSLGKWLVAVAGVCLVAAAILLVVDGSGDSAPAAGAGAGHPSPEPRPGRGANASAESDTKKAPSTDVPHPPSELGAAAARPRVLSLDAPEGGYPVVWVRKKRAVEVRTEPGGGERVYLARKRTAFGSPTVFGVLRREGDWAAVSTPEVANGQVGWVRLDPRRLRSGWVRTSIVIDLSLRRAELRKGQRTVRSFAVTVGAPGMDTPTGRYAVTDTFRGDLSAAYGCCAVAISANQPHLPSGWLGGSRIAIHGTSGPLGVAASHGCVRAADADVNALVNRAYLGTPVFIRA